MNAADNIPDVISMSWGWAEDKQCDITSCGNRTSKEYVDRVNMEYFKIGLRGVSILTASGDAARVMTLMSGEFAFFPYDLTMDITVDSNQNDGTQKIEYWYFDRA